MLATSQAKVYSFDIFDTLLKRETATPKGIFTVMQYYLRDRHCDMFPVHFIEDFFEYRKHSEEIARETLQGHRQDITLSQIYQVIQQRFGFNDEQIRILTELEIEVELDFIKEIPRNTSRAMKLLNSGKRVILISDMYLPSDVINQMFECTVPQLADCPLYLSCEVGQCKGTGGLFTHVLKNEKIQPHELLHVGDNEWSDLKVPSEMGIQTELFPIITVSEYENIYFQEQSLSHQILAGSTVHFRTVCPDALAIERVGACFAGPILYGFVQSILARAKKEKLKRIYFLARDGEILLKIARIINEQHDMGLELGYLKGARQVYHLAGLFELTWREIGLFMIRMPTLTVHTIAKRLCLSDEELFGLFPREIQGQLKSTYETISLSLAEKISAFIISDQAVRSRIFEKAQRLRALCLGYLRQEGFFDQDTVGLVDIGWTGQMQDSFYRIVSSENPRVRIFQYYFGVWHQTQYTSYWNDKYEYLLHPYSVTDRYGVLLELLTQATHGATLGYQQTPEGVFEAVCNDEHLGKYWDIDLFQRGIVSFTEKYASLSRQLPLLRHLFESITPRLLSLFFSPSREIAEVLGSVPYSSDQVDSELRECAPPLSVSQAAKYVFWSDPDERTMMTEWMEASLCRSGTLTNTIIHKLDQSIIARGARWIKRRLR